MHFLLSNDDGFQAEGLACLARAVAAIGTITVVAPDRDRSGASNSLTLDMPIRPQQAPNGFIFVNGTPTDCVHLAITGLLEEEPDMVISGINNGANLGDDVLYSGTVAAAMEGRFLGIPAMAVSLTGSAPHHYDTAVQVVLRLVDNLQKRPLQNDVLLNVNIPDVPYAELAGYEVTRLGHRHKSEPAIRAQDPRGRDVYWVGPVGGEEDAGPGTDFHAVRAGCVSVTPMQVDLTRYSSMEMLGAWLNEVDADE
ncbi:5'-nucleotidase [Methylohalomonas lacus]|uniref:5'-nucleotidase SurE n=1 Tax=Methylohalomonas lacus TaxID=398773 RepID=A0AAE3HN16_9GAMM|nr:5'/3'-nucleotidase SurE [Methylohalomonas lacus]MCS3903508.1 5'-nucleotidase [Methylohalomonas lacus]